MVTGEVVAETSGVIVNATTAKAWTEGMRDLDRPELIVFELGTDWARHRIPRRTILREVLESAAAAVAAIEEISLTDLHIRTPYGVFRLEECLFGMVELRMIDPGQMGRRCR